MTIDSTARAGALWPGLDMAPSGARAAVSAVVARRLFTAAVHRLPVTVVVETPHGPVRPAIRFRLTGAQSG